MDGMLTNVIIGSLGLAGLLYRFVSRIRLVIKEEARGTERRAPVVYRLRTQHENEEAKKSHLGRPA